MILWADEAISLVTRGAAAIAGLLLLYVAFFLTESEEKGVQNRLETLWVHVEEYRTRAVNRTTAFFHEISILSTLAFDNLLGPRLVTIRLVTLVVCWGKASTALCFGMLASNAIDSSFLIYLLFGVFLALIPESEIRTPICFFVLIVLLGLPFLVVVDEMHIHNWDYTPEVVGLLVASVVGTLIIAVTRWSLRKASHTLANLGIAVAVLLNGFLTILLLHPLLWFHRPPLWIQPVMQAVSKNGGHIHSNGEAALLTWVHASLAMLIVGCFCAIFVLVAISALAHRIIWPVIQRPVYAAQRFNLIAKHKTLATVGVASLNFAFPHNPLVEVVASLIKGG